MDEAASAAIDAVNRKYGKHTLSLGSALFLEQTPKTDRDERPRRKEQLLSGESARCRLNIPHLLSG